MHACTSAASIDPLHADKKRPIPAAGTTRPAGPGRQRARVAVPPPIPPPRPCTPPQSSPPPSTIPPRRSLSPFARHIPAARRFPARSRGSNSCPRKRKSSPRPAGPNRPDGRTTSCARARVGMTMDPDEVVAASGQLPREAKLDRALRCAVPSGPATWLEARQFGAGPRSGLARRRLSDLTTPSIHHARNKPP